MQYILFLQTQVGEKREKLTFFEECNSYWDPAPSTDELYAQLANRKYREIPAHLIRLLKALEYTLRFTLECVIVDTGLQGLWGQVSLVQSAGECGWMEAAV